MHIITTQAGQTIADIALQAYGTVSIEAMNALVADNPAVFPEGITSLVPAGAPVKVRDDAPFADAEYTRYFDGQVLNSTYEAGQVYQPPEDGEIIQPTNESKILIGRRGDWRINLHLAWQEDIYRYGAEVTVLIGQEAIEHALRTDVPEAAPEPAMTEAMTIAYEGDNIVMTLNTSNVLAVKYKIVSTL